MDFGTDVSSSGGLQHRRPKGQPFEYVRSIGHWAERNSSVQSLPEEGRAREGENIGEKLNSQGVLLQTLFALFLTFRLEPR